MPGRDIPLSVVGLAQVGVQHLLSAGVPAAGTGLDGDKCGTDLLYELRVPHPQDPTPLCLGIHAQETQAARRVLICSRHCPDLETTLRVEYLVFIQIESIESERFSFGQENASKGFRGLATRIPVV